jgi:ribonuclease P protein subunit RPR2
MSHRNNKKLQKNIANKRIQRLFRLAEDYALSNRLELSDRYVFLARKISMRYLVPIPVEFKRRFCKHCYCYLLPDINCRVRIRRKSIVTYCHNCKKYMRMPLRERSVKSRVRKGKK